MQLRLVPFLLVLGVRAGAVTLYEHTDANDPLAEGWAEAIPFQQVSVGPVFDDLGSGFDAWAVDDDGTASGDAGFYEGTLTAGEAADSETGGWTLSARLRSVDVPDPDGGGPVLGADAAPFVSYRDGATTWQLHFQTEANDDLTVYLATDFDMIDGLTHTVVGGALDYHLYELAFDPGTGLAALSVDGAEVITGYPGAPFVNAPPRVVFGSGTSAATGHGNFNLVRFELPVPEPSAPLLVLVGAGILAGASRMRR